MLCSNVIFLATDLVLALCTVIQNGYFIFKAIYDKDGGVRMYLEALSRPLPFYTVRTPTPGCA